MDRWRVEHEVEQARRSVAMLPAGGAGLGRDDSLAALAALRETLIRLRRLEQGLSALLASIENDRSGSGV